ncbi:MAG TPA: 23S rRNA (guanosine(2251)-2'-O)-methyltransferase RlmB [Nitrospinota bacterium]|nr:23S rRNA (guanosine(2251)-2'-O)-methyltransferase RlmB [Nitrospinota bacterium]
MRQSKKGNNSSRNREVIYGVNPILETLKAGNRKIYNVLVKTGALGKALRQLIDKLESKNIPIDFTSIDKIAKLANCEGHQGVIAQVSPVSYFNFDELTKQLARKSSPVILVLDGIQDPRNLGAILRSAEAFGIDGVIISERRSAKYTAVAAKSSAGAGERIRMCIVTNIAESIKKLCGEGYCCIAFESEAEAVFTSAPSGPLLLVLGSEGGGIRELTRKRCGVTAKIPMKGKAQSLNVSAAASIIFFIVSQRHKKTSP